MVRTLVPVRFGKGGVGIVRYAHQLLTELKPTNAILQGGLVKPQDTPDMTVVYPDMIVAIGGTIIEVANGNSGTVTAATAGKKKMAILEVGANGTVDITYGTEVASTDTPVAPATSADHAKICEIGPIAADTTAINAALIKNTARDMGR